MAAIFEPGHFEKLHRILTDAAASPARVANFNDWYIALDRSAAILADLARPRPPSEAERREIQAGKVMIEGVTHSLNNDFAQQTLVLAHNLDISERYAASLLQAGMQARAKWGRSAIDVACILYHREKLAAIACLKELFGGAASLQRDDESAEAQNLGAKMRQLADALLAGKTSLPRRMLDEMDSIKKSIDKTNQSIRGGGSSSTQPQFGPQQSQQQDANMRLGDEIQLLRLRMLRQQRQEIGHVLYLLSASQLLGAQGILALLEWLAALPSSSANDSIVIYIVTILLNALEPPSDDDDITGSSLMDDVSFAKQVHQQLSAKSWLPEIRSLLLLQWCLFLAEATKRSPGLANELKVHQDTLQKLFTDAVHGDALYYIVLKVLAFRQRQVDALEGEETDPTEMLASKGNAEASIDDEDGVDPEFQEYTLLQVQELVLSLTSVMLPFVRKLQRAEEDASFASSRAGGSEVNRRYDIEALFDIVALLCRARPDSGLSFWLGSEGKGTRFLNWAIEVREPGHQRALFDMVASLSAGKESAWHAHILLSSGDSSASTTSASTTPGQLMQQARFVSWSKLFDWVQQYIDLYRSAEAQGRGGSGVIMTPNEAVILRSFFRILRNVAYYSIGAREALYQHTTYQVVPRLFTLYSCPTIIEVKAAILDALAAFAHNSGSNAAKITNQLWNMLENTLGVGMQAGPGQRVNAASVSLPHANHDLQSIEIPARIYPATTSLVNLFKSLVHVPQRLDQQPIDVLTGIAASASPFQSLSFGLGQGQRSPGFDPYVDFVIDSVLIPAPTREYSDMSERWRVTSASLDFAERCLCSFDMSRLLSGESADGPALAALAFHPGFSIMKRILTGSRLLSELLNVLNPNAGVPGAPAGFEIINTERANTLFYASSVRHSLRIIQRVLQLQEGFLQVLLPTLSDAKTAMPVLESKAADSSLCTPLDTLLLHAHQSVVQIALYVNCTRNDIALLAIRIVGLLASSAAFSEVDRFGSMGYNKKMNRFVGLLEMSDEADRVRAGIVDRLESEANENNSSVDSHVKATLALMRIAGQEDDDEQLQRISAPTIDADEAIRLAIMDMLIAHTAFQKDAPNIAHLFLGFDLRATRAEEQVIPDADAVDSPPAALHAILDLLRPEPEARTMSLAQRSPAFAEKCHLLIGNLCRHPFTSTATLRYLRTKENFFSKQLRALSYTPVRRVSSDFGAIGTLVQPDGGHLTTTVDALVSSLLIRGHILSNVALELHTLCSAGLWAEANALIAVLLGRDSVLDSGPVDEDDDAFDDSIDAPHFEQRGMRLLEILTSLDFEWYDAREENAQEPTILGNLDLSQALSQHPAREFDVRATIELLAAARRELDRRGDLAESRQRMDFDKDATLILEYISSRNARRAIAIARRISMQAWRSTLDMTFSRASHLLRSVSRAGVVMDCLGALLPRLSGSTSESDPALADVIAGAVLGLFTRLRNHQTAMINDESALAELPVDRLLSLLRALMAAMVEPGTSMQARGNLYSALINYLQLVKSSPSAEDEGDLLDDDGASTIDAASEIDDSLSYAGFSAIASVDGTMRRKRTSLAESRSRSLLASQAERILPLVARDALDGADVWRTVAFALLDRLAALAASSASSRSLILDVLGRKGFLKSFVANIREMDVSLQDTLVPDPPSLNAIYVYEASVAFFNRIAQSSRGAERLVDARILDVFSQVDFLQARPQQYYPYPSEDDYDDLGSFLPALTHRYESLLMPALQLCVSIASASSKNIHKRGLTGFSLRESSSGTPTHAVARQILSFVQAHRSSLLHSLKNATNDVVSLSNLEQAQLIVDLLVFVLPVLDDDALSSPKPMSAFHQSVLALSANFLYEPHWQGRIVPHTDAEREEASQMTVDFNETIGGTSVFDSRARDGVERLLIGLLAYLERASERAGVEPSGQRMIRPCLSSSLYTQPSRGISISDDVADLTAMSTGPGRYGLHGGRASNIASLGTALASLDESIRRSNECFTALDKIQGMLDNADNVRLDEWDDVLAASASMLDGLAAGSIPPARRKTIAIRVLQSHRKASRRQLLFHLTTIEMLVIVIYRHFSYYIDTSSPTKESSAQRDAFGFGSSGGSSSLRSSTPGLALGDATSTGMPSNELAALVRDGSKICSRVTEKLDDVLVWLEGQAETLGKGGATNTPASGPLVPQADERRAFISITTRRLQSIFSEQLEGQ